MTMLRSGFYGLLYSRETLQVVTVLTPALWATECHLTFCIRICLLQLKGCSTLKWNSGRIFSWLKQQRSNTDDSQSVFLCTGEIWMQVPGREDSYFGILVFKAAGIIYVSWDEHSWPENGANNAKVTSLIPQWAIQWRVGIDDPCGPFHLKIFCESAIMFNLWFVSLSHENQISI